MRTTHKNIYNTPRTLSTPSRASIFKIAFHLALSCDVDRGGERKSQDIVQETREKINPIIPYY
jgi:hypothetical protein